MTELTDLARHHPKTRGGHGRTLRFALKHSIKLITNIARCSVCSEKSRPRKFQFEARHQDRKPAWGLAMGGKNTSPPRHLQDPFFLLPLTTTRLDTTSKHAPSTAVYGSRCACVGGLFVTVR